MADTDSSEPAKSDAIVVKFRARNYAAEATAHSLPRVPADLHPLSYAPFLSPQVVAIDEEKHGTLDPLRAPCRSVVVPSKDLENARRASKPEISGSDAAQLLGKEWTTFKRFLVQKFPPSKTVAVSSIANLVIGSHKVYEKSNAHLDELDDPQGSAEEDVTFITQQEYTARLSDMKTDILSSWDAGDHFKSLKLSVKVARLLRDTDLLQFYPTLFTQVTDILDMLGDMVIERIKRKAEFTEDGTQIRALPGYLITCIRDISLLMVPIVSSKVTIEDINSESRQVLVHLMEPPMEYIMKCIFKDHQQGCNILAELGVTRNLSELFGEYSCVSLLLHHLLKELPPEAFRSNILHILDLIERGIGSSFDQCVNFRLLGFRLYETDAPVEIVNVVLERVIQDVSQYQDLDSYLKVVDGYVDIVLQNQMKIQLEMLLEGIAERACNKWINDCELESLKSVFIKILSHTKCLENILELNFFAEIIDVMRGTAKNAINMRLLEIATRNGYIRCPTTVQFLFEVGQGLRNCNGFLSMLDSDNQHLDRLLSRFVHMVDFGTEWELHLTFLIEFRANFASADEMKETLVHRSNWLVMKALKDSKQLVSFGKSCLAFSEATIPSIANPVKQLFLYLETAEVALTIGLVCHSDGLIDSAICSLQSVVGGTPLDVDRIICIIQKLCSLLIMVPGNPIRGVTYISKSLLSLVNSNALRITARLKVRTLSANIILLAALSQHKLPYSPGDMKEVPGNDLLYFDDPSYQEELASFCRHLLQDMILAIKEEASPITRGSLALEACNSIASVLEIDDNVLCICNELMEIAGSCLSKEHFYLLSTSKLFVANHLRNLSV
ncbi:uncharacterized protein [Spinacia oleracea]|uniref:Uncharacterized protein isoform X3 n=1 Tax=Spinacia oleracea TaxID=3562 RepID=A0A9R0IQI9_SPIOL|nr:uncharacterized protein LOC110792229 isoform X3 [Spinacia oleracea]